jgi:hypothetical protein
MLVRGLKGSLGDQFVIRKDKAGRTIIANKPVFDEDRVFTERQKANHEAFQDAAAYAKSVQGENVYIDKAKGTARSAYNVAFADWYHKPQIKALDVTGWNGQAGQQILIKAVDDVRVSRVSVVITDGNGTVVEEGNAQPGEASWWTYITTVPTNGNRHLKVTALDLPGNEASTTWQNN